MRRFHYFLLLLIPACMNVLVCPAAFAGSGKEAPNLPPLPAARDSINFTQEISERVEYLQRKLELTDTQVAAVKDIVAANCYESYEEYVKMGSQPAWETKFAAQRRTKFDTELRGAVQPQQYVKFLVESEKFYKKFPFGSLL